MLGPSWLETGRSLENPGGWRGVSEWGFFLHRAAAVLCTGGSSGVTAEMMLSFLFALSRIPEISSLLLTSGHAVYSSVLY